MCAVEKCVKVEMYKEGAPFNFSSPDSLFVLAVSSNHSCPINLVPVTYGTCGGLVGSGLGLWIELPA